MVRGIDSFRDWFRGYEEQYVLIGGTACDLLMSDEGLDFRATKDIDMVLIIEAIDVSFGKRFWDFIVEAQYEHCNSSTHEPHFYRFINPKSKQYPAMIELFTRKQDAIILPEDAVLSPIPIDDSISSLSAILLDDNYYEFLKNGRTSVTGITILDAVHLIPFKAKAWLDLSDRKSKGEHVDSKNIRKHKNDVFRLSELLEPDKDYSLYMPESVKKDMNSFLDYMMAEPVDLKQIGISYRNKETIIQQLRTIFY